LPESHLILAMIIKEYRVIMPLSVEEYQVAQLYMVAKLSAQQTGALKFSELIIFVRLTQPTDSTC
jgi:hypothetical protein